MAGKLRHIAVGNNTYDLQGGNLRIFYGTCSTGATAQTKVVSIAEVSELETGDVFYIKMTNAQTYNGVPKLQINSLAAKNIARTGSVNAARYEWNAGEILEFLYDGTSMVLVDGAIANTTYYGLTKLSSAVNSSSEDLAATPKAVKTAYDQAVTVMDGATATKDGAAGRVPKPVKGDQVKFLRGDGAWVENSGSVLTVNGVSPDISKNVQIAADDIAQSAITKTGVDSVDDALGSLSQQKANEASLLIVDNGDTASQTIPADSYYYHNGKIYYTYNVISQGTSLPLGTEVPDILNVINDKYIIIKDSVILGALSANSSGFKSQNWNAVPSGYSPVLASCAPASVAGTSGKLICNVYPTDNTFYLMYHSFDTITSENSNIAIWALCKKI